jgi:nicotinamide-nucleotide adenylyltransferase
MTGVILFRAQPFHNGHLAQIKRALVEAMDYGFKLYIFVGSADKSGTKRNPIPIDVRLDLIKNSLEGELAARALRYIEVVPLDDFSDEANNTPSWGAYFYRAMCKHTDDTDFIFYYSDKPEIALSWFGDNEREHIYFKFLPRVEDDISATHIRALLASYEEVDKFYLKKYLPLYVYNAIPELHAYIINAR